MQNFTLVFDFIRRTSSLRLSSEASAQAGSNGRHIELSQRKSKRAPQSDPFGAA